MFGQGAFREAVIVVGDIVLLYAGLWLALSIRHLRPAELQYVSQHLPTFTLLFLTWIFALYVFGLYDLKRLRSLREMLRGLIGAGGTNLVWSVFFFYLFYPYAFVGMTPKTNLFLTFAIGHFGIFVWRRMAFGLLSLRQFQRPVVVLADDKLVREVHNELRRHPQFGYRVMPWCWPGTDAVIADEHWIERNWRKARDPLAAAAEHRVAVMSLSSFYERILGKVPLEYAARTGWVMDAVYTKLGGWYLPVRRVMDLTLAGVLFVVLSPVIGLTMSAVRLVDGRPVLFGQRRVGRMGREFTMWKIRTMRRGSERAGPFVRAEAREGMATRLGRCLRRFRLDELPQLWNVLKGEMAFVGPRPEMSSEVAILEHKIPHYGIRHLLRPGVTGWAQLNFKATDNPRDSLEKFRYDLYYIKNLSLDLDLTIMLRTIRRAFLSDSALHGNHSGGMRLGKRGKRVARAMGSLVRKVDR